MEFNDMRLIELALKDERVWSIYIHTNKINSKVYVGITSQSNPKNRWNYGHGYRTQPFYNAIKKYGWESFDSEIVASNLTCEEANEFEMFLIKELEASIHKNGYNTTKGGKGTKGINVDRGMYKGKNATNVRKVVCLNTMEIFDCVKDAGLKYKVNPANISAVLHGKYKSCGKDANGNKLMWCEYDRELSREDYKNKYNEMKINSMKHNSMYGKHHNSRRIINKITNKTYNSISEVEGSVDSKVRSKLKRKVEWFYLEEDR